MNKLQKIIDKFQITEVETLNKGWSTDRKFILADKNKTKYLVRISDILLYDKKKMQFEYLKKFEAKGIPCPRAVDFGILNDNEVYLLQTWLDGMAAEDVVPTLSDMEAYNLGIEAGKTMKKIHSLEIPEQSRTWGERYRAKMPKKIDKLLNCEYELPMQEKIIRYYQEHAHLAYERPLAFSHGDYHVGNMIVDNNAIGIIDFDKSEAADPYDEFKPFCWNVFASEYFETGMINGYFDNEIPDDFFPILKLYAAESMVSFLPWSVTFGEAEVKEAIKITEHVLEWYDFFNRDIPSWYKVIKAEFISEKK